MFFFIPNAIRLVINTKIPKTIANQQHPLIVFLAHPLNSTASGKYFNAPMTMNPGIIYSISMSSVAPRMKLIVARDVIELPVT